MHVWSSLGHVVLQLVIDFFRRSFPTTDGIDNTRCEYVKAPCGKTGKPFLHTGTVLKSFPAFRGKTSSTMPQPTTTAADSSIPFAGFTTADDVSVLSVDTLYLESSVST